jgi:hypothetical protein
VTPTFEPEEEPTDEELFWLLLPEILTKMEETDEQAEALRELTALSEEMGLYDQPPAWTDVEDWADQAAEWLMALQPSGVIWFSAEHDAEAEARIKKNYENMRPVKRITNKSLRKAKKS